MTKKIKKKNINLRYNIVSVLIYIIGIILMLQLFNLQIVHGQEYRQQSNVRLTRESTLNAARGSILDRNGNIIANTSMNFSLELYKSKMETNVLNDTLLKLANLLESNGDTFVDSFPITIEPYAFTFSSETRINNWKKNNNLEEAMSAEECFNYFKNKYLITQENLQDIRKIIRLRYEISTKGYSNTRSIQVSNKISRASAIQVNEQNTNFHGLAVVIEPNRNYIYSNLASHILGYTGRINEDELENKKDIYNNDSEIGKNGVEYVFEKYLKGSDGLKHIDMTVDGNITEEYIVKEAIAGSDIVLTIDANLQNITEEALENNIKKIANGGFGQRYNATAGAAVVMNARTGEILAMASYPDYEPQLFVGGISNENWKAYTEAEVSPLYNRAIQGSYAPGSIFKMVTAIAGLESKAITISEKINDIGVYPKAHNPVCWYWSSYHRGHGRLNVSDAIKHSCNFFFYETGSRMGIDTLEKYATYFGLSKKTGIELPDEANGTLAKKSIADSENRSWYLGETLSAAIGQSYNNFTPIQIAKYISILVNGGKQIQPTIVKTIINSDKSEVSKTEIEQHSNEILGLQNEEIQDFNIKQENINAVLEGMRSVTSETGGTAYSIFKNFNIELGGKTGSAEAGTKTNAWFVGFAPFNEPEIAVVVLVENGGHGNYTAEVVREIVGQYFGMNSNNVQENLNAIPYTEILR